MNIREHIFQLFKALLPLSFIFVLIALLGHRKVISTASNLHYVLYGGAVVLLIGTHFFFRNNQLIARIVKAAFLLLILLNLIASLPLFNIQQLFQPTQIFLMYAVGLTGSLLILFDHSNPILHHLENAELANWQGNKWFWPVIVFGITLLAFGLRFWHLDLLDSYRDEDHHISSVHSLFNNGYFEYTRGKLVTYCAAFFIWIAGAETYYEYLYWGRVPSTIFGALATIPIFYLGAKINRTTGLLAALLWASSPWAIGVCKNIREHSYYIAIILAFLLVFLYLLEAVTNFKKENLTKIITCSIAIMGLMIYAFFIDWLSTMKLSGVLFAAFTMAYAIVHFDLIWPILKRHKWLIVVFIGFFIAFLLLSNRSKFMNYVQVRDIRWSNTFFLPSANMPMHWWYHLLANNFLVYFLLIVGIIGAFLQKKRYFFMVLIVFSVMVLAYYFFFDRYYAPKYIFYVLPFFILLIASSLTFIGQLIFSYQDRLVRTVSLLTLVPLLFGIFSIQTIVESIVRPLRTANQGLATTGLVHQDKSPALDLLRTYNVKERENMKLISSIYEHIIYHEFPEIECIDKYNYKDPNRFKEVETIMNNNKSGFMILDSHRNGLWRKGYSREKNARFTIGNAYVTLISNKNNCQVYRWNTNVLANENKLEIADSLLYKTEFVVNMTRPFALSFWLKADKKDAGIPFLLGNTEENGVLVRTEKGGYTFDYGIHKKGNLAKTGMVNDGKWHHIVLYQYGGARGSYFGLYVDGKKMPLAKIPIHKSNDKDILLLRDYKGKLQDMRLYYDVLESTEILSIKNTGRMKQGEKIESESLFSTIPLQIPKNNASTPEP